MVWSLIDCVAFLHTSGSSAPLFQVIFTLNSCTAIPEATVCWFEDEKEMLMKWRDLFVEIDPDIITGYNCVNFDLYYLITRAQTLKLDEFKKLCKEALYIKCMLAASDFAVVLYGSSSC